MNSVNAINRQSEEVANEGPSNANVDHGPMDCESTFETSIESFENESTLSSPQAPMGDPPCDIELNVIPSGKKKHKKTNTGKKDKHKTKKSHTRTHESKIDKPKVDKPRSEKRNADSSRSEEQNTDKPKSVKSRSDKPKSDNSKSSKPKKDKLTIDRSRKDNPKSDNAVGDNSNLDNSKGDNSKAGKSSGNKSRDNKPKSNKSKSDKPKSDRKQHSTKKEESQGKQTQARGGDDALMGLNVDDSQKSDRITKIRNPSYQGWRELQQARDHELCSCDSSDSENDLETGISPGAIAVGGVRHSNGVNEDGFPSFVSAPALISAVLVEDDETYLSKAPVVEAKPVTQLLCKQIVFRVIALFIVIASVVTTIVIKTVDKNYEGSLEDNLAVTFQPIVTVSLQLDEAPTEIGWQLACDGKLLANRSVGSYTSTFQLDRQRFNVSEGSICTFVIRDVRGNGLCCENGTGNYKVHVGDDISEDVSIRMEGSSFGSEEISSFYVTEPWQLAGGITGEEVDSYTGFAVALSADGLIMAIGSTGLVSFEEGVADLGYLQVMKFDTKTNEWTQLGSNMETAIPGDYFGFAVSLSADGTKVAVSAPFSEYMTGLVRVYEYNADADEWNQLGQDLTGGTPFSVFGLSLCLSGDGTVMAAGAPSDGGILETPGFARIFHLDGNEWKQIGDDILGDEIGDHFGWASSCSGDGNLVAFGNMVPFDDRMGGFVRFFDIAKDKMSWEIHSDDLIYEHGTDDWFGFALDMSFDGSNVAVGAPGYFNILRAGEGELNSYVQVYERQGTNGWTKKGQELRGEKGGDNFGLSVSLSGDGNILAVGAPFNDRIANSAGIVTSYKFDNTTSKWVILGQPILGIEGECLTGWAVSLSKDADYLAVSSPRENANDMFQSGQTRFYTHTR